MAKVAVLKTQETKASAEDFINTIADEQQRKDCQKLIKLMEQCSKHKAKMWGAAIIGFGNIRYKSPKTGREVDWFKIGFSPRKAATTLYLIGAVQKNPNLLKKLGKHKVGGGCLYIKNLEEVDMAVLKELIQNTLKDKQTT